MSQISLGVYLTRTSRKIRFSKIILTDEVETFYEKVVTPFGNSAKIDSNRKYIGRRAYVIILKD
jgi:putative transposon-encoded protein